MTEKQYDSSDEKDVASAKRKDHNDTQAEINELRAIMGIKQGRRFMWRLLSKTGVFRTSFDRESAYMYLKEGKKQIGLELIDKLTRHCPAEYNLMQQEQLKPSESE